MYNIQIGSNLFRNSKTKPYKSVSYYKYIDLPASPYEFCFRYLQNVKNVVLLCSPQLLIQTISLHFTFTAGYQVYM